MTRISFTRLSQKPWNAHLSLLSSLYVWAHILFR